MGQYLDSLILPEDLRKVDRKVLLALAAEIRARIIDVVPRTGGHMGTNLGVVELSIALHKVFDFKKDKLIFDVGHQAYPHKLLTGRNAEFDSLRQKDGLCGFPNPWESEYDTFLIGHAGTSISSAFGMALGYQSQKMENKVVAIIGDGSICGLAFEGFNQAGAAKKNLLVILNDNKMAISPTVGAFSKYLTNVRSGELYHKLVHDFQKSLHSVPMIGETLEQMSERMLTALRDNLIPDRFFSEMGFHYYGPIDGHNLEELISTLRKLKDIEGPILLHVLTEKGRGAEGASSDPYKYHSPPSIKPAAGGKPKKSSLSWSQCFVDCLIDEAERDPSLFAITAAMAAGTKLEEFIAKYPDRAIDTGIAEAHAVTMAGGLERTGLKPVVLIYSTFLQRAYDSIMHDVCLQKDMGMIFALDRAGLVGDDGPSHHGVYDIAYMRHLPKMILMAPRDGEELKKMFLWAKLQKQPVAIRYPRGNVPELDLDLPNQPIVLGVPEVLKKGEQVALLAYGAMIPEALQAASLLQATGLNVTVVNLRFAKPLSPQHLAPILAEHELVVTLEDHVLMGGVGSAVLEMIQSEQLQCGKMIRLGIPDEFITYMSREEQFQSLGLDAVSIAAMVTEHCELRLSKTISGH